MVYSVCLFCLSAPVRKFYHVHENTVYHEDGLKNEDDNLNIEENFENVTTSHKKDELKNEDNLENENKDNLKNEELGLKCSRFRFNRFIV